MKFKIPKHMKNWKWWVVVPPLLLLAFFIITPFIVVEFIFGSIADIAGKINPANNATPKWVSKLTLWARGKDNEKTN